MPVESTELDVRVSNPIGQSVIVNKVCRNCPLKIRGCEFRVDLIILSFDEFDIILGMDCLTTHDSVVSCTQKKIVLRQMNGELMCIEIE